MQQTFFEEVPLLNLLQTAVEEAGTAEGSGGGGTKKEREGVEKRRGPSAMGRRARY